MSVDQPLPNEDAVQALADILAARMQMEGGINMLEMQVRTLVLIEHVQLLTDLLVGLSGGEHTDESITAALCAKVSKVTASIKDELSKPRLVMPSNGAGTKRN